MGTLVKMEQDTAKPKLRSDWQQTAKLRIKKSCGILVSNSAIKVAGNMVRKFRITESGHDWKAEISEITEESDAQSIASLVGGCPLYWWYLVYTLYPEGEVHHTIWPTSSQAIQHLRGVTLNAPPAPVSPDPTEDDDAEDA